MMWKYINTGHRDGHFNMKFDEMLTKIFELNSYQPILRLYGWSPPAISIGYNQNLEDFDQNKLKQNGIDIVRRPTGGRAILHSHELTYSIVIAINGKSPRIIYKYINQGLLRGLQLLGIQAELSDDDVNFRKHYETNASIACFSTSAKSEIKFHGKKLIGSAQRKFGNIILQHGSFLLGPNHKDIIKFLSCHNRDSKTIIEEAISSKTIEAESILQRPVTYEEAAIAIKRGFEIEFDIQFEELNYNDFIEKIDRSFINV